MCSRTGLVYACLQTLPPPSQRCGYARLNMLLSFRHEGIISDMSESSANMASCFMKLFITINAINFIAVQYYHDNVI